MNIVISMVFFSEIADNDLTEILLGLISWEKHPLEKTHALNYVDDIVSVCHSLDTKSFHSKTTYPAHKRYGEKVYRYGRNPQTIWYIIYDIDKYGNVFVNKIMSNHTTD
ncbi:MAG: hypothetical protein Q4G63_03185 [Bacteroidia bacterium]|nr:hypothetical protein [Bacteroidia bacterium]